MKSLITKYKFEELEFQMFVMDELAEKEKNKGKDIIKLGVGISELTPRREILDAFINAIKDSLKRDVVYPEGVPELRNAIASWYTKIGSKKTNPENVVIGTGTSPLYKDLFRLLLGGDDEVLLPKPYYPLYWISSLLTQAKIRFYRIDEKTGSIDYKDLKRAYNPRKTRVMVIASVGNPLGNVLQKQDYEEIMKMLSPFTYLISDEIYRNTSFYGNLQGVLDFASKDSKVIVTNSFSKGFRLYTTRVGFLILPDELKEPMRVLSQHALLTVNPPAQYACIEALKHLEDVEKLTSIYKKRCEYALQKLGTLKSLEIFTAQGGFNLFIYCKKFLKGNNTTSIDMAKDILFKTGVAVVPGSDFGIRNGIRVCFTNKRFNEAIDRLYSYFNN